MDRHYWLYTELKHTYIKEMEFKVLMYIHLARFLALSSHSSWTIRIFIYVLESDTLVASFLLQGFSLIHLSNLWT